MINIVEINNSIRLQRAAKWFGLADREIANNNFTEGYKAFWKALKLVPASCYDYVALSLSNGWNFPHLVGIISIY